MPCSETVLVGCLFFHWEQSWFLLQTNRIMTEVWCYFFKSSRTISTFNFSTTTTQNLRLFVLSHQNIFPFHLFISYAFLFTPFPLSERAKEDNNGFTPIFLALILGLRHVFLPHEWRKELVTKPYEIDWDANPIFAQIGSSLWRALICHANLYCNWYTS